MESKARSFCQGSTKYSPQDNGQKATTGYYVMNRLISVVSFITLAGFFGYASAVCLTGF